MARTVATTVKEVSSTLYRLLLHPSNAPLDGELYYEDDAWRFRDKGLDIQDFAPSFIEVYQCAAPSPDENDDSVLSGLNRDTELQVFVYSFSYLPDPTWLVNWENGTSMEDWFETGNVRIAERSKKQDTRIAASTDVSVTVSLELDLGEYLSGATVELWDGENEGRLRILSFTTNQNRDLVINKESKSRKLYRLRLPEGFGIIGRFPAPRYSFGFYVSWMTPRKWTMRTHLWFPERFRQTVQTLLLAFHRISSAAKRVDDAVGLPFSVLQLILQRLAVEEATPASEGMNTVEWTFLHETDT